MIKKDQTSATHILNHLNTNGLEDLELPEFCDALIKAINKGREQDGWCEEVHIEITKDFFEFENAYTADGRSTKLVLTEQAKRYLCSQLSGVQVQYWIGDQTHHSHLESKANRKEIPFDMLVRNKFDEAVCPDNGRHVNYDQSSPYRGGASSNATFL